MTSRTTRRLVAEQTDQSHLIIEAVIVAHVTVRRAAVASLITVAPRRPSRTVDGEVIHGPHRRKTAA